jgi:hypothetical protein
MKKIGAQCWAALRPEASACWPNPTVKLVQAPVSAGGWHARDHRKKQGRGAADEWA